MKDSIVRWSEINVSDRMVPILFFIPSLPWLTYYEKTQGRNVPIRVQGTALYDGMYNVNIERVTQSLCSTPCEKMFAVVLPRDFTVFPTSSGFIELLEEEGYTDPPLSEIVPPHDMDNEQTQSPIPTIGSSSFIGCDDDDKSFPLVESVDTTNTDFSTIHLEEDPLVDTSLPIPITLTTTTPTPTPFTNRSPALEYWQIIIVCFIVLGIMSLCFVRLWF